VVATGQGGAIRHAYYVAATLGSWRMEWEPRPPIHHINVVASILTKDTYQLEQTPLKLVLEVGGGVREWSWDDPKIEVDGDTAKIAVRGKPESRLLSSENEATGS